VAQKLLEKKNWRAEFSSLENGKNTSEHQGAYSWPKHDAQTKTSKSMGHESNQSAF